MTAASVSSAMRRISGSAHSNSFTALVSLSVLYLRLQQVPSFLALFTSTTITKLASASISRLHKSRMNSTRPQQKSPQPGIFVLPATFIASITTGESDQLSGNFSVISGCPNLFLCNRSYELTNGMIFRIFG